MHFDVEMAAASAYDWLNRAGETSDWTYFGQIFLAYRRLLFSS